MTDPKSAAKRVTGWKPWIQPESGKPAEVVEAWMEGRTGVPFLDANMMELRQSGFMSNRGRQNVASFLTKDLCELLAFRSAGAVTSLNPH